MNMQFGKALSRFQVIPQRKHLKLFVFFNVLLFSNQSGDADLPDDIQETQMMKRFNKT